MTPVPDGIAVKARSGSARMRTSIGRCAAADCRRPAQDRDTARREKDFEGVVRDEHPHALSRKCALTNGSAPSPLLDGQRIPEKDESASVNGYKTFRASLSRLEQ